MVTRFGFSRSVKPRNPNEDWRYDTTTTTSPSQSAAAVRTELGLGYDFSGLDSTIRPTLDRSGGEVRPVQPASPVATTPRYTGTPSPWLSPNAPRAVPNVVATVPAARAVPNVVASAPAPPVFDSSSYAGVAGMFAPSGAVGVRPPTAPVSTGTFDGYTEDDANRFIEAVQAGGGLGLGATTPSMTWTAGGEGALLDYLAEQQLNMAERQQERELAAAMGAGGGGGGTTAADLAALEAFINDAIARVGETYGGYGATLEEKRVAAAQRIADANAAALARLQGVAPMAQFDYRFQPTVQPMAGGMDYLRAIGAPTSQVDATRQLGQQLMANQMQSAQDFANASADAAAQERLARIAAVEAAGLQGVSGLESTAAALQAQIAASQVAEERALQQALLENRLKYGVA